jgi:hypothetical protein
MFFAGSTTLTLLLCTIELVSSTKKVQETGFSDPQNGKTGLLIRNAFYGFMEFPELVKPFSYLQ